MSVQRPELTSKDRGKWWRCNCSCGGREEDRGRMVRTIYTSHVHKLWHMGGGVTESKCTETRTYQVE